MFMIFRKGQVVGAIWRPKPDITPYELALCLKLFTPTAHHSQEYEDLPLEARRHFIEEGPAQS